MCTLILVLFLFLVYSIIYLAFYKDDEDMVYFAVSFFPPFTPFIFIGALWVIYLRTYKSDWKCFLGHEFHYVYGKSTRSESVYTCFKCNEGKNIYRGGKQ